MPDPRLVVLKLKSTDSFYAKCWSCGWHGPHRDDSDTALDDANGHEKLAHDVEDEIPNDDQSHLY